MSCPLRDIFGRPGEGVHSTRFLGMAAVDLFGTIAVAGAIAYFAKINFWLTLLVALVLGEILHFLFGAQTAFLTAIGVSVLCNADT